MAIKIGSNIASLQAQRAMTAASSSLEKIYERLSSGQRINSASDDAAGLAISTSLSASAKIYGQAIRNINDGISAVSIAEAAISQLSNITQRQKELASQSANGSFSSIQRSALDREAQALTDEYNRILETTKFNGIQLFTDNLQSISIQAGKSGNDSIAFEVGSELTTVSGSGDFESSEINFSGSQQFESFDIQFTQDYNGTGAGTNYATEYIYLDGLSIGFDADGDGNDFADVIVSLSYYMTATEVADAVMGQFASALYTTERISGDTIRFTSTYIAMDLTSPGMPTYALLSGNSNSSGGSSSISNGSYFEFSVSDGAGGSDAYYVYYTDTAGFNDPAIAGKTGIEVAGDFFSWNDAALNSATYSAISAALPTEISILQNSTSLIISNLNTGSVSDITNGNTSLSVSTTNQGIDAGSISISAENIDLTSASSALQALDTLTERQQKISLELGKLGSVQSRLDVAVAVAQSSRENYLAAASRITDAEIAEESSNLVRTQILQNSAAAILAQANQQPSLALRLLS